MFRYLDNCQRLKDLPAGTGRLVGAIMLAAEVVREGWAVSEPVNV